MENGPPMVAAHTHRLPPVVRLAVVGLTAAVFLLLIATGLLATYVYQQQQYIQGKGAQRDRENARLEESQRRATCDLLDQLPQGALLDRPREKYGCGPGIPLADLPPAVRQRYAPTPAPAPPTPRVVPAPLGEPATPIPTPAVPSAPREGPGPGGPTPAPESPSLLHPVTDPVCDLTGLCI